ncbi:MAG: 4-phosphopantetheinyl transferase [Rickettsiales bacterium]|jgi:phosphopantetheine--protein transferase-like protein|nr:4-phosphopantetheinyl transferase [Rickettsiales bacterium]
MIANSPPVAQWFSLFLSQLPEEIKLCVSQENFSLSLLSLEERALCASWGSKRLQHFVNGRVCAHRALTSLKVAEASPILRSEKGIPLWPRKIVGSITHTEGAGAAAVALASDYKAIGVDIEHANRCHKGLWARVFSEKEIVWINEAGNSEVQVIRATAGFSLKESYYKCFSVLTGASLDLMDIEIIPNTEGKVRVKDRTNRLEAVSEGMWEVSEGYILSLVFVK